MNRAAAGAVGKQRGADFENFLADHVFKHALAGGLFRRVDRQHPDTAPMHCGGKVPHHILTAQSGADWIALLCRAAGSPYAYVAMEAKSTAEDMLCLSALADHQIDHLNDAAKEGQGALLLLRMGRAGEMFAVPWARAPWTTTGRGSSLRAASLPSEWLLFNWTTLRNILCPPSTQK